MHNAATTGHIDDQGIYHDAASTGCLKPAALTQEEIVAKIAAEKADAADKIEKARLTPRPTQKFPANREKE